MYQTNLGDYDVLLQRITLPDSPNHVYKIVEIGKQVTSIKKDTKGNYGTFTNVQSDLSAIDESGYVKVDVKEITGEEHD